MQVKCNQCGYVGDESEFPKGRDFFQNAYVASCPKKCGNRQSPRDASMRMFGKERPFTYVREAEPEPGGNIELSYLIYLADDKSTFKEDLRRYLDRPEIKRLIED